MKNFSDLNIKVESTSFIGEKIKISKVLNRDIIVLDFKIDESKYPKNKSGKVLTLQIKVDNEQRIIFTGSDYLISQIQQVTKQDFPFATKIEKNGEYFEFK